MVRLDRLEQDYRDAVQHIYGLAHTVCIDGYEQKALLEMLSKVEREALQDGSTGQEIVVRLLNVIYDGLLYGNWPFWTEANQKQAEARMNRK